jgi:hypothetical protein
MHGQQLLVSFDQREATQRGNGIVECNRIPDNRVQRFGWRVKKRGKYLPRDLLRASYANRRS